MAVPSLAAWRYLLVLAVGAPVLLSVGNALAYSLGGVGLLSQGWTLAYWQAVLADRQTWIALGYSAYVALASLGGSTLLALGLVFALGARVRQWPLRVLLYVPLAMPPLVAALVTAQLFGASGVLARVAQAFGWIDQPAAFASPVFSPSGSGIVLAHAALVTPFLVLLFDRIRRIERIDALVQVAQALGATPWQSLRTVAVPTLLTAARPALTVYLIVLAGAFEIPLLVGAQFPQMDSVLIWTRYAQFDLATRPQAYALAVLYAVILVGAMLLAQRGARHSPRCEP